MTSAPPPHRATTAHLQAVYPFVAGTGLPTRGVYIGRDLLGAAFAYDPWELYRAGTITSPNALVIGQIGRGKSALVKSYVWRQLVFGRHAWLVDPKGEYGRLAERAGGTPIRLAPGGPVRLNPLDRPDGDREDAHRRRCELLDSLASASLGRPLLPAERTAADLALAEVGGRRPATIPAVVDALLLPTAASAASVRTTVDGLAADGRQLALELRRLVDGDLRGMFDGETSPGIDLAAPIVVLDLSSVYGSPALALLMTCATAWLHAALARQDRVRRIVVVDEAWAVLSNLAVARWLRASAKLSRAHGVATMVVVHRLSDLTAAGDQSSEQVRLARGLLSDVETRIVYGQPPSEVDAARDLLGLSEPEAALLPRLPRGVALWKVGGCTVLVEHRLGRAERAMVDTDARMAPGHVPPTGA